MSEYKNDIVQLDVQYNCLMNKSIYETLEAKKKCEPCKKQTKMKSLFVCPHKKQVQDLKKYVYELERYVMELQQKNQVLREYLYE